jgi:hypothetical protein
MYANTIKFQESLSLGDVPDYISLGDVPDDRPLGDVPDENLGVNYAINHKQIQCCTIY